MSRILLADDSPHAQRMGERILRDEGHEVITVSDGLVAMLRLKDAQPDLVIADISMPEVTGYELCEYVKNNGGMPVFLTAGAVESVDESEVSRVRADGVLKKPFEATILLAALERSGVGSKRRPNGGPASAARTTLPPRSGSGPPRSVVVLDPEQVRAAVTVALDAALPALVDEISAKVLAALQGTGRKAGA
jgi:CheY-like chemotaxis protein